MTGGRKNKEDSEIKDRTGDIPGGPVVKTSPFNVGAAGLIPGQGVKILLQATAHCCVCVCCVCPKSKGIRTYHSKYTLGWHIGILICICVSCLTLFDLMGLLIIFR